MKKKMMTRIRMSDCSCEETKVPKTILMAREKSVSDICEVLRLC